MLCPKCGTLTKVYGEYINETGTKVKRFRECMESSCGKRIMTMETLMPVTMNRLQLEQMDALLHGYRPVKKKPANSGGAQKPIRPLASVPKLHIVDPRDDPKAERKKKYQALVKKRRQGIGNENA